MPRQPSRSINIVTAEELPVLTSPRSAKTIERRKRHKPDTQVTSRNPFHEETKPHLTKQSYPRTRVNSIKRQGCFHFQPEEMHPLESIMREAKLSVFLKLLYCIELLSKWWWKLHMFGCCFLWNANTDKRDFAWLRPDAEWGSPKSSFIEDFL